MPTLHLSPPPPSFLPSGARLGHGLMRALGMSKAVLVGHSAGAAVAVEMALR